MIKKIKERLFYRELIQQLVTLSTSGFGLVAVLITYQLSKLASRFNQK